MRGLTLALALATAVQVLAVDGQLPVPEFVEVPAGAFTMGWTRKCVPVRDVQLSRPFRVSRFEISNDDYCAALNQALRMELVVLDDFWVLSTTSGDRLLQVKGREVDIQFDETAGCFQVRPGSSVLQAIEQTRTRTGVETAKLVRSIGEWPVRNVTWFGSAAYCNWLSIWQGFEPTYDERNEWVRRPGSEMNYRLPSEAEWEYVARGPDSWRSPFSPKSLRLSSRDEKDGTARFGQGHPDPRGTFSSGGDSWCGASDMSRSVWEWTADRYGPLGADSVVDPIGALTGSDRVLKGWGYEFGTPWVEVASRSFAPDSTSLPTVGFRIVSAAAE